MMNDTFDLRGAPVYDANGEIGRVTDVTDLQGSRQSGDLWVMLNGQDRPIRIARDQVSEATPERVTLAVPRDQLRNDDQTIRVPLHEEILEATTHEVERGHVRVRKTVETVPYEETFMVGSEDVSVEHVPVDQMVDHAPEPRWEGDTLIVPLVEEVLVVEKRLRVHEELHVTRKRSEKQRTVHEDLRREVARIETTGDIDVPGAG